MFSKKYFFSKTISKKNRKIFFFQKTFSKNFSIFFRKNIFFKNNFKKKFEKKSKKMRTWKRTHAHAGACIWYHLSFVLFLLWLYNIIWKIRGNGQPVLQIFEFGESRDQILSQNARTHTQVHIYDIIRLSLSSSYGVTTSFRKWGETVKPFLRYSNLTNRAIWLVSGFLPKF